MSKDTEKGEIMEKTQNVEKQQEAELEQTLAQEEVEVVDDFWAERSPEYTREFRNTLLGGVTWFMDPELDGPETDLWQKKFFTPEYCGF